MNSFGTGTARRVAGVCLPLTEKFDPLDLGNTDTWQQRLRSEGIWTEIDRFNELLSFVFEEHTVVGLAFVTHGFVQPLGACRIEDAKMDRYTQVEIKHGRSGRDSDFELTLRPVVCTFFLTLHSLHKRPLVNGSKILVRPIKTSVQHHSTLQID